MEGSWKVRGRPWKVGGRPWKVRGALEGHDEPDLEAGPQRQLRVVPDRAALRPCPRSERVDEAQALAASVDDWLGGASKAHAARHAVAEER